MGINGRISKALPLLPEDGSSFFLKRRWAFSTARFLARHDRQNNWITNTASSLIEEVLEATNILFFFPDTAEWSFTSLSGARQQEYFLLNLYVSPSAEGLAKMHSPVEVLKAKVSRKKYKFKIKC